MRQQSICLTVVAIALLGGWTFGAATTGPAHEEVVVTPRSTDAWEAFGELRSTGLAVILAGESRPLVVPGEMRF